MSGGDSSAELPSWEVLDRFFLEGGSADCSNPLVRHQVSTINEFLDKKLSQIVEGFNPIQVCHNYKPEAADFAYKVYVSVVRPSLGKPLYQAPDGTQVLMTPHMARMNNLTYAGSLYVDVHIVTELINEDGILERSETAVPGVCLGKVPIMVRSKACMLSQMPALGEGAGRNECRYDPGGYFIVNGNEKVIISQDRISENRTLVFAPNGNADGLHAEIRSMPDGVFLPPKTTSLHLSGKPNHMGRVIRLSTSFLRSEVPLFVMFRALGVESDLDIFHYILLDPEDPRNTRLATELGACAEDACDIHGVADARAVLLRVLGTTGTPREYMEQPERAARVLEETIAADFLPHVGRDLGKKALYLGYMVRKLLRIHLGYQDYDNRDSYLHKRIDTPGVLFSNLFRQCYGKIIKEMRNLIVRELNLWRANPGAGQLNVISANNIHRFFKQNLLDTGLRYALSTGNWGVKTIGSFQNIRAGVAQVLNRMSYLSTLSHLRRINTPMEKNGKLVQPRKLENTQFGLICPNETPEGTSVGLVKNMALSSTITIGMSSDHIRELLGDLPVALFAAMVVGGTGGGGGGTGGGGGAGAGGAGGGGGAREYLRAMGGAAAVLVVVNGDVMGYTEDPVAVYRAMRSYKRRGVIPPMTSVVWNIRERTLCLSTEAGRLCRPLCIVDDGGHEVRLLARGAAAYLEGKTFQDLLAPVGTGEEGVVELLDTDEIDAAMIAMSPRDLLRGKRGTTLPPEHTHCEVHPCLLNGVLAANIPFMEHNQAPRNCYQSAMGKQAVGIYASNFTNRIDTMAHVLHYPQRPLVRSRLSRYTNTDQLPSGINAVVAIMTHMGFNQEDSVMINQSALDRGLFTSTYYKSYRDQCNKNHSTGEEEVFTTPNPQNTSGMKPYNYGKLGPDGLVPKNTWVDGNDILVGKVMPYKSNGVIYPRDTSHVMKGNDEGHVDANYVGMNAESYTFAKVRLRKYRKAMIGDKGACAVSGHDVLTSRGFIPIEQVTTEDYVAVLKDGTRLVYEKPEAVHHYPDFEGKIYHISNQGIDLDVTMNHRMWVSRRTYQRLPTGRYKDVWSDYDFEYAENIIGKRLRYKADAEWDMPDYQFILPEYVGGHNGKDVRPARPLDMDAWLTFFGIWMAEGWVQNGTVAMAGHKPRVQKALAEVLPKLGYTYNLSKDKKVCISNVQLCQVFRPLSVGAVNKYLPDWVWSLSQRQSRILLQGLILGDGHWTTTSIGYSTSSLKLRDDVYRLAIHCGYAAYIIKRKWDPDNPPTKKDGTKIIQTTDAWIVQIKKTRTCPTVNHGHVHEQEIQEEYTYDYKGPVYCLTVSSGVFMVRKNFKHVWTGNSR